MKRLISVVMLAVLLVVAAPAWGQEPEDQYSLSTASLEPVNAYGLSVPGCEELLSQFGVEESVTFGTPPEQVWYCLSVVEEIPPAAPAADGEPLIGDLPCEAPPGAIAQCGDQHRVRIMRALEAAGVEVAGNTFPPPRILPDTGGISPLAFGPGALLLACGAAGLLVQRRMAKTTGSSPKD